jgi:threonine/homoserine/homoserine lactone efflux protein
MPTLSTLSLFIVASLTLLVIPGPAVLYILSRTLHQGRRAGFASVLGIAAGSTIHVVTAALGLSALLLAPSLAFSMVKYAGAAYLIYLGERAWLSKDGHEVVTALRSVRLRRIFAQGVLVQVLNPKAALFFFAFLPQFVDPHRGPVARQVALLGGLFMVLSICSDGLYASIAGYLGGYLQRHPYYWRKQRYVTGGIYVTLGLTAALASDARK